MRAAASQCRSSWSAPASDRHTTSSRDVPAQGLSEAGLDYGGLMKELLEEVAQRGLDPLMGLFAVTPDGLAHARPAALHLDMGEQLLEFLGKKCPLYYIRYQPVDC